MASQGSENCLGGRDSSKTPEIFKSSASFLILTNMFRWYMRHCQCDSYKSLQLIKHACYNVQYTLHNTLEKINTLYINLKLTKLIDVCAPIYI